ncbi:hypothetical protein BaRGS_00020359 [Batillaria attramentaria]|uniref:Uncharacterized protein n=1 Tax=Batillaria attramentaria TaxID=370345 RepID=A0ABD0KMD2_9CAEN
MTQQELCFLFPEFSILVQPLVHMFSVRFLCFHTSLWIFQLIPPPWKPDVKSAWDTKYIPEEFAQESMQLTPSDHHQLHDRLDPINEDPELPYFEQFSYHGSGRSYGGGGYLSASAHTTSELF